MRKNYLYASVTVVLWATLATVVKLVLKDLPNFEALAVSSAFAFLFLLGLNGINGFLKQMKTFRPKDYLITAGLGFLGLFLYSALYYFGINTLGAQEACILKATPHNSRRTACLNIIPSACPKNLGKASALP